MDQNILRTCSSEEPAFIGIIDHKTGCRSADFISDFRCFISLVPITTSGMFVLKIKIQDFLQVRESVQCTSVQCTLLTLQGRTKPLSRGGGPDLVDNEMTTVHLN